MTATTPVRNTTRTEPHYKIKKAAKKLNIDTEELLRLILKNSEINLLINLEIDYNNLPPEYHKEYDRIRNYAGEEPNFAKFMVNPTVTCIEDLKKLDLLYDLSKHLLNFKLHYQALLGEKVEKEKSAMEILNEKSELLLCPGLFPIKHKRYEALDNQTIFELIENRQTRNVKLKNGGMVQYNHRHIFHSNLRRKILKDTWSPDPLNPLEDSFSFFLKLENCYISVEDLKKLAIIEKEEPKDYSWLTETSAKERNVKICCMLIELYKNDNQILQKDAYEKIIREILEISDAQEISKQQLKCKTPAAILSVISDTKTWRDRAKILKKAKLESTDEIPSSKSIRKAVMHHLANLQK